MKKTLGSLVIACALGCTGNGEGSGGHALSGVEPEQAQAGERCEEVCSPYDPGDCRTVCPPEPPDASIPDDPYQGSGDQGSGDQDPTPSPEPVDAGTPGDPFARAHPTDGCGDGHRVS